MILVDTNILIYAHNPAATLFARARAWWDEQLSGTAPVCLDWVIIGAFIRIATHPSIYQPPATTRDAIDRVDRWLVQPCVRVLTPTERHWEVFNRLLVEGQATGNLVTDAHIAALAIEYGCELQSTDADFARFPSVKWRNPLKITT